MNILMLLLVAEISTPAEAYVFFRDSLTYIADSVDTWQSYQVTLERGGGDCEDIAIFFALSLADDGYEPLVALGYHSKGGHAIFVYQSDGKWGAIGCGKMDVIPPIYKSVNQLMLVSGYIYYYLKRVNINEKSLSSREDIRDCLEDYVPAEEVL